MAVSIGEVALTDFHSRVVMLADGGLNLQTAFAKPGAAPAPAKAEPAKTKTKATTKAATATASAPPADAPMPIAIGKLTLQGGQVTFSDRSIQPAYSAELSDLSGRITGLSSVAGTTADVDVHGAINRSGALVIAGKVNPLAKEIALDVQVSLKDIELPPASPYTGKYAGYVIDKGKLDLALAYKIANRKLDAQNKLVLDQFTFGDKVDSPDAVKLPVRLAVALLKDRRGVIDIDLPIAGSLDDPEFKVWGAVLKVLGNLVVKAVTAPFSLIASAFGGGDELSRIDFAAGRVGAGRHRAEAPGHARARRCASGPASRSRSRAAPIPRRIARGCGAWSTSASSRPRSSPRWCNRAPPSRRSMIWRSIPASARRCSRRLTRRRRSPSPRTASAWRRRSRPRRWRTLMLSNTRVEDDDLKALALRRATVVQSALAKTVPGGASRLFLVTPRLAGPGGHAEFKLKKD